MDRITHPHERSRASIADILTSFAERLKEVPSLNGQNVVISDQPTPIIMPGGRECLSVSLGGGRFPTKPWESSHHAQATSEMNVVIGIFIQRNLDRPGRAEVALVSDGDSLFAWLAKVLAMLTVAEPAKRQLSQSWEPSKNGRPLCRSIPRPVRVSDPGQVPEHAGWIGLHLTFAIEFDWDLYAVQF